MEKVWSAQVRTAKERISAAGRLEESIHERLHGTLTDSGPVCVVLIRVFSLNGRWGNSIFRTAYSPFPCAGARLNGVMDKKLWWNQNWSLGPNLTHLEDNFKAWSTTLSGIVLELKYHNWNKNVSFLIKIFGKNLCWEWNAGPKMGTSGMRSFISFLLDGEAPPVTKKKKN